MESKHHPDGGVDALFDITVFEPRYSIHAESWPVSTFRTSVRIKRGGLYQYAKPQQALHCQNPAVRHDHCVERSGATRQKLSCFSSSVGRQVCDHLRARTCPQMYQPRMFLCETLSVRTRDSLRPERSAWAIGRPRRKFLKRYSTAPQRGAELCTAFITEDCVISQ